MFNINDLLQKVKSLRNSDIAIRMSVQSAIKTNTQIEIPIENISIKSGRAMVQKMPQIIKGEIFIKKIQILDDIKKSLGEGKIKDII